MLPVARTLAVWLAGGGRPADAATAHVSATCSCQAISCMYAHGHVQCTAEAECVGLRHQLCHISDG
jgi:hypothetical protein